MAHQAVGRAFDPRACREDAARRFSVELMVQRYERLFGSLAPGAGAPRPSTRPEKDAGALPGAGRSLYA
jgi:hypothetical protein